MVVMDIDHYFVLGLPSGEEGLKLSQEEIRKAYLSKAIELHPDKNKKRSSSDEEEETPHADFVKLHRSYEILSNKESRKLFDNRFLRSKKRKQPDAQKQRASKRTKNHEPDVEVTFRESNNGVIDKNKVIRVSWCKTKGGYGEFTLQLMFSKYGTVQDIAILSNNSDDLGLALLLMDSKDSAVAAAGYKFCIASPIKVVPLSEYSKISHHEESLLAELASPSRRAKVYCLKNYRFCN